MFKLFRWANLSSTRVIVCVSVHTSIRPARRTNSCSYSTEIVQLLICRNSNPSPIFLDQQRSTTPVVRHVASTTIMFAEVPTKAQPNGFAVNACLIPPDSLL